MIWHSARLPRLRPPAPNPGDSTVRAGALTRRASGLATTLWAAYVGGKTREVLVQAEGWYRDPYLVHEDRWFSAGQPTKLVRDGGVEDYDPPPAGPPKMELVELRSTQPSDGSDLRRADDPSAQAVYDPKAAFWAISGTI